MGRSFYKKAGYPEAKKGRPADAERPENNKFTTRKYLLWRFYAWKLSLLDKTVRLGIDLVLLSCSGE